jgi:hypothetical protein
VNVDNYADPVVSIDAPVHGSVLSGVVDIQVTASAAPGRTLTGVEGYLDDAYLGGDTSAPYSIAWDTTQDDDGTYVLTVVATDDYGQTGADSVTVTLDNEVSVVTAHVAGVVVTLEQRRNNCYGIAAVSITDGRDNPLERVRVSGYWSLATTDRDTGLTDSNGMIVFRSDRLRVAAPGTVFRFTVDHVSWADGLWDGVIQSDEAMVP